ncbi:hypothetical protein NDU88_005606 [Pleurodeles waltl]|uniref:Uncharacterized protein n=1 Tax=Pleurodeles waltl TaxID=8319 RepID=A0AAV7TUF2_PLEWA|nr:hypothetical protein NDU88_005606 [Pleurodeles waltl]
MYISYLPDHLSQEEGIAAVIGGKELVCLLCAGDLIVLDLTPKGLNNRLKALQRNSVPHHQEVTTPAARIAGSEQGKRDSDEVWRQRRSKDGAEQGALLVFVYCRDQALSVSVRRDQSVFVCRRERALSVSVYRRDSRIE